MSSAWISFQLVTFPMEIDISSRSNSNVFLACQKGFAVEFSRTRPIQWHVYIKSNFPWKWKTRCAHTHTRIVVQCGHESVFLGEIWLSLKLCWEWNMLGIDFPTFFSSYWLLFSAHQQYNTCDITHRSRNSTWTSFFSLHASVPRRWVLSSYRSEMLLRFDCWRFHLARRSSTDEMIKSFKLQLGLYVFDLHGIALDMDI